MAKVPSRALFPDALLVATLVLLNLVPEHVALLLLPMLLLLAALLFLILFESLQSLLLGVAPALTIQRPFLVDEADCSLTLHSALLEAKNLLHAHDLDDHGPALLQFSNLLQGIPRQLQGQTLHAHGPLMVSLCLSLSTSLMESGCL